MKNGSSSNFKCSYIISLFSQHDSRELFWHAAGHKMCSWKIIVEIYVTCWLFWQGLGFNPNRWPFCSSYTFHRNVEKSIVQLRKDLKIISHLSGTWGQGAHALGRPLFHRYPFPPPRIIADDRFSGDALIEISFWLQAIALPHNWPPKIMPRGRLVSASMGLPLPHPTHAPSP